MIFSVLRRQSVQSALASAGAQASASAASFLITLYLVRALEKSEFGLYSTFFAAATAMAGLAGAVFGLPMTVHFGDRTPSEQRGSVRSNAQWVLCIGIALVALASIASVLAPQASQVHMIQGAAAALVIATAFSVREIFGRYFFYVKRPGSALLSNVLVFAGIVLLLGALYATGRPVTWTQGLYCFAFGQVCGALSGALNFGRDFLRVDRDEMRTTLLESWTAGKWTAASSVLYALRTQAHVLLLLPLGVAAVADANAAKVLIAPALLIIPVMSQVAMPELVRRRSDSIKRMWEAGRNATLLLVGAMAVYSLALIFASHFGLSLLLGSKYANSGPYVLAWCVVALALALRNGLMIFLQAAKRFKDVLAGNALSVTVLLLASTLLIPALGGPGSVYAIACAEVAIALVFGRLVRRQVRA